MGGRGGAPGARPERRMGSVGAAEPRGQPRHRQQQEEEEEEEEEPGSLERVEKSSSCRNFCSNPRPESLHGVPSSSFLQVVTP